MTGAAGKGDSVSDRMPEGEVTTYKPLHAKSPKNGSVVGIDSSLSNRWGEAFGWLSKSSEKTARSSEALKNRIVEAKRTAALEERKGSFSPAPRTESDLFAWDEDCDQDFHGATSSVSHGTTSHVRSTSSTKRLKQDPIDSALRFPVWATSAKDAPDQKESRVIGFLVSYDKSSRGDVYPLEVGRVIVSSVRTGSTGKFLVIDDPSISHLHAVMKVRADGTVEIKDQLSENGTAITKAKQKKESVLEGAVSVAQHGDIIRFGSRNFHVCTVHFA